MCTYLFVSACVHRDGKIVDCHEWSDSGVKRHICEVQVLLQMDRMDLTVKCNEYGELRNLAGR